MIELKNVSKYYSQENNVTLGLRNINVKLNNNEFIAITGESGSGKTTFLNVVSGIDTYEEGELLFNGEETSYFSTEDFEKYRKENIGFIFQNYNLIDSYTVLQNVEIPLILKGYSKKERQERAIEIIKKVGLLKRIKHKATKLSGGEKQRVVIARALASDAKVLACDEPTGNLDSKTGKQIIELLKEISKDKLVLIVTHNFKEVEEYCTRKLRFFDGELVEDTILKPLEVNPKDNALVKESLIKRTNNWKISAWFSVHNLKNTPRRTLLSFSVILGAIFTFMILIASISTEYESDTYLNGFNLSNDRIVIKNKDNSPFSPDDLNKLINNSKVEYVEKTEHLSDYPISFINDSRLLYYDSFAGFRDVKSLNKDSLSYGRLPVNENEILINAKSYYYNKEEIIDKELIIKNDSIEIKLKIVGLYDDSNIGNYKFIIGQETLKEKLFDLYSKERNSIKALYNNEFNEKISFLYNFSDTIEKPIIFYSKNLTESLISIKYYDFYQNIEIKDVEYGESLLGNDKIILSLPTNYLYNLLDETYQVSVYLKNTYKLKNQVKSFITEDREVLHKVLYSNNEDNLGNIIGKIVNLFFSFVGLFIMSIFTGIILYFIFNHKKKDYAIFRSLGANNKIIGKIILVENFIMCIIGNILLIILCGIIGKVNNIKLFEPYYRLDFNIIFLNLLGILFLTVFVSIYFNKTLFKHSINKNLKKEN